MSAHNFKDLTGMRFGRLVAQRFVGHTAGKSRWECVCDCGKKTTKVYQHLVHGLTQSCGCKRKEVAAVNMRERTTTHGFSQTAWYVIWKGMMDRCYNVDAARYHRYGGRGIAVCAAWHSPAAFYASMGNRPAGRSLDRVDNDKDYAPENCRWATPKEQNNNRCSTKKIAFDGRVMSGAAWAETIGISKAALYARLRSWPLETALTKKKK